MALYEPPPQINEFGWIWRKWFSGLWDNIKTISADRHGNIGVKTDVLSEWDEDYSAFQLGGNASLLANKTQGASKSLSVAQNAYFNGFWRYQSTDEASYYYQASGTHVFQIAASGMAGALITWKSGVTIDNKANVGIGVTPEAWETSFTALQVGGTGSFVSETATGASKSLSIAQNAYYDGAWKYQNTDEASYCYQSSGRHVFQIAPSGTADTAITWTMALEIDNSANIVLSSAALTTTATDGFTYMPTCAGTPTGVPTSKTGAVAFVYDTTNDIIYIYRGGWKATAALT